MQNKGIRKDKKLEYIREQEGYERSWSSRNRIGGGTEQDLTVVYISNLIPLDIHHAILALAKALRYCKGNLKELWNITQNTW